MHRNHVLTVIAFSALAVVFASGCGADSSEPTADAGNGDSSVPALPPDTVELGHDDHGHDHDHPSEGPHHGHLIELGGEEYHAELVHDENAGTVTVYILGGDVKESVPIEASDIAINLKHDGKGEQFKLAAAPDEDDPEGKSSRFVSNDKELGEDLHAEDADAQLVVAIADKSYRGHIEHDHDHGHDHHDRPDHEGHDHD